MKTRNNKRRKGFTLIELIVVIAILAILAAVAVPNFIGLTAKANEATQIAAAAEFCNAINVHNAMGLTKITSKGADLTALSGLLGDLAPTLSSGVNAAAVFARITVSSTGIATSTPVATPTP